jgi:CheY-like chemotaxis protein
MKTSDQIWVEHGYGTRFQGFQNLMRYRIRNILLVSSLYDLYLFEEDGRLYELIRNEYLGLNLSHSPEITRVPSGIEAIALAKEEQRFDLIITTLHIEDMPAAQLARMVRESALDIHIVLLTYDNNELKDLVERGDAEAFDKVFVWQGDFRIIMAIVKYFEDRMNVEHDTRTVGIQTIILIEDNIKFYSSFLPMIYTELLQQSKRVISEGINISHKYLRMRARPKILLCSSFEEAMEYYETYRDFLLGVISDVDFYRGGKPDERAGIEFARIVIDRQPDIPVLLASNQPEWEQEARMLGVSFLIKDSPMLLYQLRQFMTDHFSFGDFIFRLPDGREVGRAHDLESLENELRRVPAESIKYHAERNHFSNWLKARTEFWLAHRLRPRRVSDFPTLEELRQDLILSLRHYRHLRTRGIINEFSKDLYDPENSFSRIGGGSLGGKARGLGFVNMLINNYNVRDRFEGIRIYVPSGVVLGTEVFEEFIEMNNLRQIVFGTKSDEEIRSLFVNANKFPESVLGELAAFLDLVTVPLAVRSSSLLEDSQYHPFAGVYETVMIPNKHTNALVRLNDLLIAIKHVYASTFFNRAKEYIKMTSYRLEEEKMAVIIQRVVGRDHYGRYYPDFSGVAKSHNFYPVPPQKPSDGIIAVALGLGRHVVEGGNCIRFSPKYPTRRMQTASTGEILDTLQHDFYALDMNATTDTVLNAPGELLKKNDIEVAESDGTLAPIGSTYSPENDVIYDGIGRDGMRIVSFAPLLKSKLFPLPDILQLLLDMGSWGMGAPVEIEFAVTYSTPPGEPKDVGILQMRPMVINRELEELDVEERNTEQLLCRSPQVLGNGIVRTIRDIVFVDKQKFERSKSKEVAREVTQFNQKLLSQKRPYLLVGVGRWGTNDPWLGIPVSWANISGARAIIETNPKDMDITPSQGSHFFQNITSFMIGYFTVDSTSEAGFVDWNWLLSQPPAEEKQYTKHLQFSEPLIVKINGRKNKGIIFKPNGLV